MDEREPEPPPPATSERRSRFDRDDVPDDAQLQLTEHGKRMLAAICGQPAGGAGGTEK